MKLNINRHPLLAAIATGVLALAHTSACASPPQGDWKYESFTSYPGSGSQPPRIAAGWTPNSDMKLTTGIAGKITGSATLPGPKGPIPFEIEGQYEPDGPNGSESIVLTVTVKATGSVYRLQGYSPADSNHYVGTVVAISNDLGRQPDGQSGPFMLYPQ